MWGVLLGVGDHRRGTADHTATMCGGEQPAGVAGREGGAAVVVRGF